MADGVERCQRGDDQLPGREAAWKRIKESSDIVAADKAEPWLT